MGGGRVSYFLPRIFLPLRPWPKLNFLFFNSDRAAFHMLQPNPLFSTHDYMHIQECDFTYMQIVMSHVCGEKWMRLQRAGTEFDKVFVHFGNVPITYWGKVDVKNTLASRDPLSKFRRRVCDLPVLFSNVSYPPRIIGPAESNTNRISLHRQYEQRRYENFSDLLYGSILDNNISIFYLPY